MRASSRHQQGSRLRGFTGCAAGVMGYTHMGRFPSYTPVHGGERASSMKAHAGGLVQLLNRSCTLPPDVLRGAGAPCCSRTCRAARAFRSIDATHTHTPDARRHDGGPMRRRQHLWATCRMRTGPPPTWVAGLPVAPLCARLALLRTTVPHSQHMSQSRHRQPGERSEHAPWVGACWACDLPPPSPPPAAAMKPPPLCGPSQAHRAGTSPPVQ